jgi:hypothetical protein
MARLVKESDPWIAQDPVVEVPCLTQGYRILVEDLGAGCESEEALLSQPAKAERPGRQAVEPTLGERMGPPTFWHPGNLGGTFRPWVAPFAPEIKAQVDIQLKRAARLRQGILRQAFKGRLVPQGPTDEPAEKLLECIRQRRSMVSPADRGNRGARPAARRRRAAVALPVSHEAEGDDQGGDS